MNLSNPGSVEPAEVPVDVERIAFPLPALTQPNPNANLCKLNICINFIPELRVDLRRLNPTPGPKATRAPPWYILSPLPRPLREEARDGIGGCHPQFPAIATPPFRAGQHESASSPKPVF